MSLSLSQHEVMASAHVFTSCSAGPDLPIAALDQLQWVKIVPKVSLVASTVTSASASTSTSTPASVVDHPLWWPCLLFNEYVDFQDFFHDELEFSDDDDDDDDDDDNDDDDDSVTSRTRTVGSKKKNKNAKRIAAALEAKRLILSRIFTNMLQLQRKPILVARLLGRSIQDHIEVVLGVVPEDEDDEEEEKKKGEEDGVAVPPSCRPAVQAQQTLESYQATEYMPFTALSSHEIHRQMDPKAFAIVDVDVDGVSNEDSTTTTVLIDDELYMNYMLALDLASTQRMGGLDAPNTTLRSDFRDIGRAELTKLSPTITKLSDIIHTTTITTTTTTSATSITTSTTCVITTNCNNGDDNSDVDDDRMEENSKEEGCNSDRSIVIAMTKRMKLKLQSLPLMLRKRKHHNQKKQKILKRWTAKMHKHQRCRKKSTSLPSELLQKQDLCQGFIPRRPASVSTTSTDDAVDYYSFNNDDDIIKGEEPNNKHEHEEDNHDDLEDEKDEQPSLAISSSSSSSSSLSPIVGTAILPTTLASSSHENEEDGIVHATHNVNENENSDDDVRVRTLFDAFLDDLIKYYPVDLVEEILVLCNCYIMTFTNRSNQLVNYFIID